MEPLESRLVVEKSPSTSVSVKKQVITVIILVAFFFFANVSVLLTVDWCYVRFSLVKIIIYLVLLCTAQVP